MLFLGAGLGLACFLAGRFSVSPRPARSTANHVVDFDSTAEVAGTFGGNTAPSASVETGQPSESAISSRGWNEAEWRQLRSAPGTSSRNAMLARLLEELATSEPARALALAQADGNLKLREILVQASLRGWARANPASAARWALVLPDANNRDQALSMVFAGAVAADPDAAVQLGKSLIQQNPGEAPGYGARLIDALCDAGQFATAVQLAAGGDRESRTGWMASAYSKWAEFQPDAAARAAAALADSDLRSQALHGIVGGWATVDPAALVNFVVQLPPDADKAPLLSQSLEYWARQDPKNASAWIDKSDDRPELDQGVAAVATMSALKSDVALSWAESISNPTLRSETVATVVRNWMTTDLAAARDYFKTSQTLLPADRQQLDEVFAGLGRPSIP